MAQLETIKMATAPNKAELDSLTPELSKNNDSEKCKETDRVITSNSKDPDLKENPNNESQLQDLCNQEQNIATYKDNACDTEPTELISDISLPQMTHEDERKTIKETPELQHQDDLGSATKHENSPMQNSLQIVALPHKKSQVTPKPINKRNLGSSMDSDIAAFQLEEQLRQIMMVYHTRRFDIANQLFNFRSDFNAVQSSFTASSKPTIKHSSAKYFVAPYRKIPLVPNYAPSGVTRKGRIRATSTANENTKTSEYKSIVFDECEDLDSASALHRKHGFNNRQDCESVTPEDDKLTTVSHVTALSKKKSVRFAPGTREINREDKVSYWDYINRITGLPSIMHDSQDTDDGETPIHEIPDLKSNLPKIIANHHETPFMKLARSPSKLAPKPKLNKVYKIQLNPQPKPAERPATAGSNLRSSLESVQTNHRKAARLRSRQTKISPQAPPMQAREAFVTPANGVRHINGVIVTTVTSATAYPSAIHLPATPTRRTPVAYIRSKWHKLTRS